MPILYVLLRHSFFSQSRLYRGLTERSNDLLPSTKCTGQSDLNWYLKLRDEDAWSNSWLFRFWISVKIYGRLNCQIGLSTENLHLIYIVNGYKSIMICCVLHYIEQWNVSLLNLTSSFFFSNDVPFCSFIVMWQMMWCCFVMLRAVKRWWRLTADSFDICMYPNFFVWFISNAPHVCQDFSLGWQWICVFIKWKREREELISLPVLASLLTWWCFPQWYIVFH